MAHRTAVELEEERLEILAAQRDRAAFAPLYERYVDQIHAYVYTLTHDMEQADDVTAATFAKALEELPRFEWRGVPYSAWLYRVAGNLVSRERRRPGWIELEPRMLPDSDADPAMHAEENDRADRSGPRWQGSRTTSARRSCCVSAATFAIGRSPRSWAEAKGR